MRAKNIYLGKKGQGEGTLLGDFIGCVWERGFYKNNVGLKNKIKQAQPNNNPGRGPCMTPGMVLEDGDPRPLEILSKFHGQEGFYCVLSFPQHFTCPQYSHILQSHLEGDLGATPKKGSEQKPNWSCW